MSDSCRWKPLILGTVAAFCVVVVVWVADFEALTGSGSAAVDPAVPTLRPVITPVSHSSHDETNTSNLGDVLPHLRGGHGTTSPLSMPASSHGETDGDAQLPVGVRLPRADEEVGEYVLTVAKPVLSTAARNWHERQGGCRDREEWTAHHCTWMPPQLRDSNRFLVVHPDTSLPEGLGNAAVFTVGYVRSWCTATRTAQHWRLTACITRSGPIDMAMRLHLHPVFNGAIAGHGLGDFSEWLGLASSPLLRRYSDVVGMRDIAWHNVSDTKPMEYFAARGGYARPGAVVDSPDGVDVWQPNQAFQHTAGMARQIMLKGWGYLSPRGPLADANTCTFARQVVRQVFWSVPKPRSRCVPVLNEHLCNVTTQRTEPACAAAVEWDWTIGVHVRRGDAVALGKPYRMEPLGFYVATTAAVLRAIAELQPNARVLVMVFSEGVDGVMVDVLGRPIMWHSLPACDEYGLRCTLVHELRADDVFDTVECMATVDVLIGSASSFSHLAQALSSNVQLIPVYWMQPPLKKKQAEYDNGDGAQDSLNYFKPSSDGRWSKLKATRISDKKTVARLLATPVGRLARHLTGALYSSNIPGVVHGPGRDIIQANAYMNKRRSEMSRKEKQKATKRRRALRLLSDKGVWTMPSKLETGILRLLARWMACRHDAVAGGQGTYFQRAIPGELVAANTTHAGVSG